MSFQYPDEAFGESQPLHTLVLVDTRNRRQAAEPRNAIAQCLSALRHARRLGLPVCFFHQARRRFRDGGWIEGLAPTRHDRLFVRRGPSCFDSPYFNEAAAGILALAGFLARDAILATARDAIRHARKIVFLEDALVPPPGALAEQLSETARTSIQSCPTQRWIEATDRNDRPLPGAGSP